MRCPVCDDDVMLVISSREGIEIDHCPQCRGVWLDRGELDKIIERAAPSVVGGPPATAAPAAGPPGATAPAPQDQYGQWESRDRGHDPRDDRRRRRRSFLEEIFDFD